MKQLFLIALLSGACMIGASGQGGYTIENYRVDIKVNKDASLNIVETLDVNFTETRHGIFRLIPIKYKLIDLPEGIEKADRQFESKGYANTFIEDINVADWKFEVNTRGDYKEIKIGSKDAYVTGNQRYVISYTLLNTINFFNEKSEFYFNLIGHEWDTSIDSVGFSIQLYEALPAEPHFFVATGRIGSTENNTTSKWTDNKIFSGSSTSPLQSNEGLTVGIVFPPGFLEKQNYHLRGISSLMLPVFVFILTFLAWFKWGKDDKLTITTEFYPPDHVSPGIAGYLIDGSLNKRDLTALIPYWGAGGYLRIEEANGFFGNSSEYFFIKLKDLPASAMSFEKTLFNGIFSTGDTVRLSSLKNVLYVQMDAATTELKAEIDKGAFYEKDSKSAGCVLFLIGVILMAGGVANFLMHPDEPWWTPLAFFMSGLIVITFGGVMTKKTPKGNELFQKLAGFKEFIKKVEKERLEQFLKEDEHYFDKVLPFAIVFDIADTWKDKLKGLEVPPPAWYEGINYTGFNAGMFLNRLDNSMNAMTNAFYSSPPPPSSSGSSGGSWSSSSSGSGSSGGGFGGGGGGSW